MPRLAAFAPEIFGECEPFAPIVRRAPEPIFKREPIAPSPVAEMRTAGRNPASRHRLQFVYLSQNCRCWFCGEEFLGRENATRDHLTPLSRGGTNEWANLVLACMPCNSRKRDLTLEEYRQQPRVSIKANNWLFYGEMV